MRFPLRRLPRSTAQKFRMTGLVLERKGGVGDFARQRLLLPPARISRSLEAMFTVSHFLAAAEPGPNA